MAESEPQTAPLNLLEADDTDDGTFDNDSSYGGSERNTETTSIASEVTSYRNENGRRYHGYKDGAYLMPNDEMEQDRIDLHHHIFSLAHQDKLYLAPINGPQRVLDVGTGTGIWAIDFGDEHPESHVVGIELSPIQPHWVAPNVEFYIEDAEEEWAGKPYDFIHIRMLSGAIKDWDALLKRAFDHLNPGGYIEVTEFEVWNHSYNNTLDSAPHIQQWQKGLSEAAVKIGRRMDVAVHLKEWIAEAGFEDVKKTKISVPTGPWPKNIEMKNLGTYMLLNMLDAASSYGQAHFTRVLGWTAQEYEILSGLVRTQLKDRKTQLYSDLYTVYARKPRDEDETGEEVGV